MSVREGPLKRILLLSFGWILAMLALLAWRVSRMPSLADLEAGGGVGSVSFGLHESAILLLGPPLLLWCLWMILRRRPTSE